MFLKEIHREFIWAFDSFFWEFRFYTNEWSNIFFFDYRRTILYRFHLHTCRLSPTSAYFSDVSDSTTFLMDFSWEMAMSFVGWFVRWRLSSTVNLWMNEWSNEQKKCIASLRWNLHLALDMTTEYFHFMTQFP